MIEKPVTTALQVHSSPLAAATENTVDVASKVTPLFRWPLKNIRNFVPKVDEPSPSSLDLPVSQESEVLAIDDGKVMFKGPMGHFGNMVILGHRRGYTSVYGRLSDIWVGMGQIVNQGEPIGKIEPKSDGGLHFEIRFGGKNKNPLTLLPKFH